MDCNERKPSAVPTQQKKSAFRIIIKVAIYDRLMAMSVRNTAVSKKPDKSNKAHNK